jgi:hypothetical protein
MAERSPNAIRPNSGIVSIEGHKARMRPNQGRIRPNRHDLTMTAPYQSKLIPHENFIRECRAKRWCYPRIAAALLEQHGLKAGATTIFDFVKVRARKRRLIELPAKPSSTEIPNLAGGFFENPAQPKLRNESKTKYNLGL